MKTITLRNIPNELYLAVKALAERNRRSFQQQVLVLLDLARIYNTDSPVASASRIRNRLISEGQNRGDVVNEVRSLREAR